jgi:hypothetical protein
VSAQRLANLRAALAFLRLSPTEPELRLLHRTFDNWHGLGLVSVGVERQDMRLSLSHIAEGEWRATFMENEKWAPRGFGVAPTPWGAVQRAAWARRDDQSIAGCLFAALLDVQSKCWRARHTDAYGLDVRS